LNTPYHLGLILDGNRRWAVANEMPTLKGHWKGYLNLETIADEAFNRGVRVVSAFCFSMENWNRSDEEVTYLMKLVVRLINSKLKKYKTKNIRIVVIGSRERLSRTVTDCIDHAEAETKDNDGGVLALCFNYGGHVEIVDAIKGIVSDCVPIDKVDKDLVNKYIYHPEVPPCDLIVRTSGEMRLSGYMLWRADYSEFMFVDKHWPDFNKSDLAKCLAEYDRRQRRFGK
jgi:undecaprenyl diphosphate synthase